MKKIFIIFSLFLCFQIVSQKTYGQYARESFKPFWSIGLSAGTNLFYGDIKEYKFFPISNNKNEIGYGTALHVGRQFTPAFGLRIQGLYGQLYGTHRTDDRYFEAEILEGNICAVFDLANLIIGYNPDRFLSPYAFIGLGVTNYKSDLSTFKNGTLISKEGYTGDFNLIGTKFIGAMPVGIGFNFQLAHRFSLNLEYSFHILNTDYLDGTKKDFAYDMYNYTSIGFSYQFKQKKSSNTPVQTPIPDFTKSDSDEKDAIEQVNDSTQVKEEPVIDYESLRKAAQEKVSDPVLDQLKDKKETIEEEAEKLIEEDPAKFENKETIPALKGKFYSVQIIAKQAGKLDIDKFRNENNIEIPVKESWYKGFSIYTVGEFPSFNEALGLRKEMIDKYGFKGAFIVIFNNGERIK